MAKGDDIQSRLTDLAGGVLRLCDSLPLTGSGRHIAEQLRRSGTSPAANYAEARVAESRRDFLHKLGIVLKELKETSVWLTLVLRQYPDAKKVVASLEEETTQLCKIMATSLRTARGGGTRD
jgi:four helix bundle protein